MAVLGTPNIGPNGTIVTNTIYGMGDDDLLQLPRINRNQITVGKFIGKYSTLPISEKIWVKNVRAIVVCGFLMK